MVQSTMPVATAAIDHLPASMQKLIGLIEANKTSMTPEKARDFLEASGISAEDVMPWADFGHPLRDGYGRKLVYDAGYFEIMVMSWVPGDYSSIHDHGTAQWGAVKCLGHAEHAVFEMRDGELVTRCRTPFTLGQVNAVTHELIHQMGNVDQTPFCSLHLYGSYDHNGDVTGDSRIFDLFEEKIQYTTGGVFFVLPESDISRREVGITADYITTQRHHVEMLRRIHRFLPHCDDEERDLLREKARHLVNRLLSPEDAAWMREDMEQLSDARGHILDENTWRLFWREINVAAEFKAAMQPIYG